MVTGSRSTVGQAQELDVPIAIHPTLEPVATNPHLRSAWVTNWLVLQCLRRFRLTDGVHHIFQYGVFDRFPISNWLSWNPGPAGLIWLDRMERSTKCQLGVLQTERAAEHLFAQTVLDLRRS